MTLHRRTLLSLAALAPLAGLAQPAFPRKPVKIIVNFAVGGPLDVMARVLAENLSARVGQPVIVENVTGANGNLGVAALLRADPDGHTLLFTAENAITVSPHVYANLGYDPLADMTPLRLVGAFEQVLTVPASSDIRTVADFVRKAKEGKLNYASAGNGSPGHLAFLSFASRAGIRGTHVPYRGNAPAVNDLRAGHVDAAFVVIGVSAYYLRRNRFQDVSRTALNMGLGLIALLAPLQLVIGDLHGLNTFEHQPVKIAAMEGHWETQRGAPLTLFAIPDEEQERNHFEVSIPKLGSLILTHELLGEIRGLKDWPPEERPPVAIVFYSFRVMVGIGLLMILVGLISLYLRIRGRLYDSPRFLRLCSWCLPIGFIALLAGWFTTEVGRQPWVVYGMLRTVDATSPVLTGGNVLTSLLVYILAYSVIFGAGIYYLYRIVRQGPTGGELLGGLVGARRPLSAPGTSMEGEDR